MIKHILEEDICYFACSASTFCVASVLLRLGQAIQIQVAIQVFAEVRCYAVRSLPTERHCHWPT